MQNLIFIQLVSFESFSGELLKIELRVKSDTLI